MVDTTAQLPKTFKSAESEKAFYESKGFIEKLDHAAITEVTAVRVPNEFTADFCCKVVAIVQNKKTVDWKACGDAMKDGHKFYNSVQQLAEYETLKDSQVAAI